MASFSAKSLKATITLGKGTFAGGGNQVILTGLRIVADIDKAGGISMGTARFKIYGMRQVDMNQLTMLAFHPLTNPNNTIRIEATDDGITSVAYDGTIISAWAEYQAAPDVYLTMTAMTGYYASINPVTPTSFKGATDVATIMSGLAAQMGFAFEGNGVSVSLSNPYLQGTALEQARSVARAANLDLYLDDKTLAITQKGVARGTQAIPLISKDTGLVGYPSFDRMGISFTCLYNPAILFGGLIKIQSAVTIANGQWRVVSVGHTLESEKPSGAWFSHIWCTDNVLTVSK